jgi:hypothetical protein
MLRQFLIGGGIAVINIAIHAFVMSLVIAVAQRGARTQVEHPALFLAVVMIPTVSVLMATHALEVMVWALAYSIVKAAPTGTDWMYFAFVNYATLGYGDIVPVPRWRLLGPITSMNGALMFGWSTAVIFEVMRKAMERGARPR